MKRIFGSARTFITFSLLITLLSLLSLLNSGCRAGNGPDEPLSAPIMTVSPRQIANGNVVLNSAVDQTVSIKNTGTANLSIGAVAQANPLAAPFSLVNDNCSGRTLSAAGTCTFQVRFSPTIQGPVEDSFDIPSNDFFGNSAAVNVSGSGKALRVAINQVNTDQCPNIELLMTVMDKNNNLVWGLTPSNIQLLENSGDLTGAITNFLMVPPPPVPVSISIVMDYSTSLQSQINAMEAAARSFVGTMSSSDEASIVKFATASPVYQPFTADVNLLYQAIALTFSGDRNETHLYDALWAAVDQTGSKTGNIRAIVVISDGVDINFNATGNGSTRTLPGVIAHATQKNVAVFAIGLGNVNGGVMNQLATGTGGQYFYAPSPEQLNYSAIKNALSGQYSLTYSSPSHGSVMLNVTVTDQTNGNEGNVSRRIQGCP